MRATKRSVLMPKSSSSGLSRLRSRPNKTFSRLPSQPEVNTQLLMLSCAGHAFTMHNPHRLQSFSGAGAPGDFSAGAFIAYPVRF